MAVEYSRLSNGDSEGNAHANGQVDEHAGLLPPKEEDGKAGLLSCVAALCNTILGTGMLAMAHSVASCGLLPGIFIIFFSGGMSCFGLYLLSRSASLVRPARTASFASIADMTYPRATVLFDLAIAIKCAGVSCSYLIIIGGLMPRVVLSFDRDPPDWALDRRLWIVGSMVILTPLCFLRHLHSLRFISYIALVAVVDLVLVVVWKFFDRTDLPPTAPTHLFVLSTSIISSTPVYIFAFTCAQNLFAVFNEVKSNTQERMNLVMGTSIGSAAVIYQLIGILGYLTFGETVPSNIMTAYHDSELINICRAGIVILVLFSYPLQIHPCRASVTHLFPAPSSASPAGAEAVKHILITTFLLLITFVISINITQLELVLGIIGATGSTTISFILPALFYLKLFPAGEWRGSRMLARALLVAGIAVMIICLGVNIYHAVR